MIMPKINHMQILILDAIAFRGGSKVATESIAEQLINENIKVSVLTRDACSWKHPDIKRYTYMEFPFLSRCEQGLGYFIRHAWIALFVFFVWLRCLGKVQVMGASGPGVDFSMYILSYFVDIKKIQLVHGPVAPSKTIGRCLLKADLLAYLPSEKISVMRAINLIVDQPLALDFFGKTSTIPMNNGLVASKWPTKNNYQNKTIKILWAASLLRWKGLDLLLKAMLRFNEKEVPKTTICYIKPKDIDLPVSGIPVSTNFLSVLESPSDFDEIRSQHNVFVSTSQKEPFGLSILEAMAAGLCVLIPADGAYWDTVLIDGVNCIKYRGNDEKDLFEKLFYISINPDLTRKIGEASCVVAQDYRAESTYSPIVNGIKSLASHNYK